MHRLTVLKCYAARESSGSKLSLPEATSIMDSQERPLKEGALESNGVVVFAAANGIQIGVVERDPNAAEEADTDAACGSGIALVQLGCRLQPELHEVPQHPVGFATTCPHILWKVV
jgi:hypothetical protein